MSYMGRRLCVQMPLMEWLRVQSGRRTGWRQGPLSIVYVTGRATVTSTRSVSQFDLVGGFDFKLSVGLVAAVA
jgi:hypothetical protein